MALDASAFVSGEGDSFIIDSSEESTLVADDVGLPVATAGQMSSPTHSLFQQGLQAIRLRAFLGWGMRDSGKVAVVENVTW
jgi:hypothetical protein